MSATLAQTKRLLLAALKVWELNHGISENDFMANKNTKRTRVSVGYKAKTGRNVNSSALRKASGKRSANLPASS